MANPICWIEFRSGNTAADAEFYGKLFGWQSQSFDPKYMTFTAGGGPGGGFNATKPEMPQNLAYIMVEDIEAKLAEIQAAGGQTVFPKTQISPESGWFAFFKDLSGNIVGLWSQG